MPPPITPTPPGLDAQNSGLSLEGCGADTKQATTPEVSKDDQDPGLDLEGEEVSFARRLEMIEWRCNEWEKVLLPGVVQPESDQTGFSDIHATPSTVRSLRQLTTLAMFRPDAFTYGILSKDKVLGVLLYGPPGTGKTLLAKAVANESHATVLEVTSADLLQCQLGDSEKIVRAIFSLAKKLEPCVIFVDEADSLFFRRSSSDQQHRRTLINQFLREWDGIASGGNVSGFIMMATNRPSDLDPAVLRRLPRRILVDIPTCAGRKEILNIHLRDEILGRDCSTADLAEKTPLFSGSDLENLCVAAAIASVYEEEFGSGEMPRVVNGKAGGKKSKKPTMSNETRPRRTLCARHFDIALGQVSASADPSLIMSNRRFGKTGLEGANQGGSSEQPSVSYD
ncbi:MAG: hypothetical protein M1839_002765 [Geoglossum umbratile]|nr:MAG: hypothetical protein M1839_002765 [Geoglossum umbratile]